MIVDAPSRIGDLITRLEANETPTQEELERLADLQLLDVAKFGEDYVRAACGSNERETERFREYLEVAPNGPESSGG